MSKLAWIDAAVRVVEAAAKDPTFPGDESPVKGVIERLVNKALSECHNGNKELGLDGCLVCRAVRTEKIEAERDAWQRAVKNATDEANKARAKAKADFERAEAAKERAETINKHYLLTVEELNAAKAALSAAELASRDAAAYANARSRERDDVVAELRRVTAERDDASNRWQRLSRAIQAGLE